MITVTCPALIVIGNEAFYLSPPKDFEDGLFDDLCFPEDKLAQVAALGNYAEQVYGVDAPYDAEIRKAVMRDFVACLADLNYSDIPNSSGLYGIKDLDMPAEFAPLIGKHDYIEQLRNHYSGDEEVGYKDRAGLHLTGIKLADLINDHLYEDRLIQSIEKCLSESFVGRARTVYGEFYTALHFLHFTDAMAALNACAAIEGDHVAVDRLAAEMNLSKGSLGLSKYTQVESCAIGAAGRSLNDVRPYCQYPALVSIDGDAVFVACEEDFDIVSDVMRENLDEDEARKWFDLDPDEELNEYIWDYLADARGELAQALGFVGGSESGKPNGEYETEVLDYKINRALGILKAYDAALPIVGLWQPAELAFTPDTRLYISTGERDEVVKLDFFIAYRVTDKEIAKAAEHFHETHADIPTREKFTSVTMDIFGGIDALNMLALLYDSREVAALALVDAAAKRGITITGVAFR